MGAQNLGFPIDFDSRLYNSVRHYRATLSETNTQRDKQNQTDTQPLTDRRRDMTTSDCGASVSQQTHAQLARNIILHRFRFQNDDLHHPHRGQPPCCGGEALHQ